MGGYIHDRPIVISIGDWSWNVSSTLSDNQQCWRTLRRNYDIYFWQAREVAEWARLVPYAYHTMYNQKPGVTILIVYANRLYSLSCHQLSCLKRPLKNIPHRLLAQNPFSKHHNKARWRRVCRGFIVQFSVHIVVVTFSPLVLTFVCGLLLLLYHAHVYSIQLRA